MQTSGSLRLVGESSESAPARKDDTIQRIVRLQTELAALRQERDVLHERVSMPPKRSVATWLSIGASLLALATSVVALAVVLSIAGEAPRAPTASMQLPSDPRPEPVTAPAIEPAVEPPPVAAQPAVAAPVDVAETLDDAEVEEIAASDEPTPAVESDQGSRDRLTPGQRRRRAARRERRRAARAARARGSDDAIRGLESLSM